ncbi:MAG: universal stress protein [Nocardioidaceae bacterium]
MTTTAKTVVVGVDGSPDGDRAVEYASELAERDHLDLRLVHVSYDYRVHSPMSPYLPRAMAREIGESVLQAAAKHADEAGFPGDRITTVLAQGPRAASLLQHVEDADYVVLGNRTSTVKHLLTGALSLSVAAHSPVPVRCVPTSWEHSRVPSGRIVAAVDGSRADPEVLQAAFAEADVAGARLEVVHAWPAVAPYDAALTGRVLDDQWERAAREQLTRSIKLVSFAHPAVDWELSLSYERVPFAVHEAARSADLLVLGRHGHHAPMGLLVGSNTRTLLRTAPCPVEVVPIGTRQADERN